MTITAKKFKEATGSDPEKDDLERCNCKYAGTVDHWECGWCDVHNMPNFLHGCNLPLDKRVLRLSAEDLETLAKNLTGLGTVVSFLAAIQRCIEFVPTPMQRRQLTTLYEYLKEKEEKDRKIFLAHVCRTHRLS